jgi:hypothetical protein
MAITLSSQQRWARVLAVLAFVSVVWWLPTVSAAQESGTGATRQLDGWQKAKFGMNFEQVKAQYPEAKVKTFVVERCKGDLTEEDRRESPTWKKDGMPHLACRYLQIDNYDSGQDLFKVKIYFSKTRGLLFQIAMDAQDAGKRRKQDYESYLDILKSKYGDFKSELHEPKYSCQWVADKLDNVLRDHMVISKMVGAYYKQYVSIFSFMNGKVSIYFEEPIHCEEYFPMIRRDPSWQKAINEGLDKKRLGLLYHNAEEERAIGDRF